MDYRNSTASGSLYALMATLLWGSYPLWYSPFAGISSDLLLTIRVISSLFFVLIFLWIAKGVGFVTVGELLKNRRSRYVLFASAAITAIWWLSYIIGVTNGMVLEASLGYFISPIFSIFFGYIIFRERPNSMQWIAIFLTFSSVLYLLVAMGRAPWISLIIGFCFSVYGAIRKGTSIQPLAGLSVECMVLFPFAVGYLGYVGFLSDNPIDFSFSTMQWALFPMLGFISVLPLLWYSLSTKKLSMITLSFFQFIPPFCNFIFAVFVFKEGFTVHHSIAFALIWLASLVYMLNLIGLRFPFIQEAKV